MSWGSRALLTFASMAIGATVATTLSPSASARKSKEITAERMAAFSYTLSEGPSDKGAPYKLKLVAFSDPSECYQPTSCQRVRLYIVIIGDGEAPEYKVYDGGDAVDWEFVSWHPSPTRYFDDSRDKFGFEIRKTSRCRQPACKAGSDMTETLKAEVSLWGFRWLN